MISIDFDYLFVLRLSHSCRRGWKFPIARLDCQRISILIVPTPAHRPGNPGASQPITVRTCAKKPMVIVNMVIVPAPLGGV